MLPRLLFLLAFTPSALFAQTPPTPPRTLLQTDLQGVPGQEAMVQIVNIPPGAATPKHIHPDGHEIVYVLEGETVVEIDGAATKTFAAGELVHIAPNVPHLGRNASTSASLKLLVMRIKDKTKPIMIPVK